MSKAGKRDAGAIPSGRTTVRRSASKARKDAKPRIYARTRRIGTLGSGGGDGESIRLQPETAEMLRVLAAAYTKF
jgi:hypothetical protein